MAAQPAFLTDPKILKAIVHDIERGVHQNAAAQAAGVKESEFESWLEKGRAGKEPYAAFAAEVDAALNAFEKRLNGVLNAAVFESMRPDASTAKWLLERRFPKRYRAQKDEAAPAIPIKPDGRQYSAEELAAAAKYQEEAAARAKARLEAERKNQS